MQCVGPWVEDKHNYLRRFIEATRGPRAQYLTSAPGRPAGGAAFIDLFAGPGRARVRETGKFIRGSPAIAVEQSDAPFSDVILCDIEAENIGALRKRLSGHEKRIHVVEGDCNATIDEVVRLTPPYGLNTALIDPYGLMPLSFETIRKLACVKRMDLIVHFPIGDIKRNFQRCLDTDYLDTFLGITTWREQVRDPSDAAKLIDIFRDRLGAFDYRQEQVRSVPIKNSTNVVMYDLVYATKHPKGNAIWQSIARTTPSGQRGFNF